MKWLMRILVPSFLVMMWYSGSSMADVNVGGDIVVKKDQTLENAVSVGGSVHVYGTVAESAVSVGGKVVIEPGGKVYGDVVTVGGVITLKDSASICGDAVVVGGSIDAAPTAAISGEKVRISFPSLQTPPLSDIMHSIVRSISLGPAIGFTDTVTSKMLFVLYILTMLVWLATASLLNIFAPLRAARMAAAVGGRPFMCLFMGFLVAFMAPLIIVILLIILIGIPFVPFVLGFVFIMHIYGGMGIALKIGSLFPRSETRSATQNIVLGVLTTGLVMLIPFIGIAVWIVLLLTSLGVVTVSRFGSRDVA